MGKAASAIQPTRSEDYPEWYQQVIKAADLAENSPVRGCMVIKPWGYAIWENMQSVLDRMFKDTGHRNAYFPLFIPLSLLQKEAGHVEGFAKECAVVTHSRLEADADGILRPAGPLEEPLIVRPTSETIIGEIYAKWVQSYRDLPLLINQWANVVRWEMRTRLFLRTAEFLWQEGHTVHATEAEAQEETRRMLAVYADFARNYMAMPVIEGEKTEGERFPGAVSTLTIEAMMQDGKALQAGTSHFLGQNFAKASGIKFLGREGVEEFAWTTSWGVTTRLIGALIMTHSDDDGLVLPPRLAPEQVVIIPVVPKEEQRAIVMEYAQRLRARLMEVDFSSSRLRVHIDERDLRGGEKVWSWVKKGVPLRVEVGPRDVENEAVMVSRRDRGPKEKEAMPANEFVGQVVCLLDDVQSSLLAKAKNFREAHTRRLHSREEFDAFFAESDGVAATGGFGLIPWADDEAATELLARDYKITVRCVPFEGQESNPGACLFSGKAGNKLALVARAY